MARTDEVILEHGGERYYSTAAAATYLHRSPAWLYAAATREGIKRFTFPMQGKRRFFREHDLDAIKNAGPREVPFEMAV